MKLSKKVILLLLCTIFFVSGAKAQSLTKFKLQNSLIGFGTGSRKQGDLVSARWLLASDITGLSLILAQYALGAVFVIAAQAIALGPF